MGKLQRLLSSVESHSWLRLKRAELNILHFRIISILLVVVYVVLWSFISIHRYLSMKANVWDLGYAANLIGSILTTKWSFSLVVTQFAHQGILFFLAPLSIFTSIPEILVFQSVMLGLPIYLIFEITYHETESTTIATILSIAYFFFFPLAGANWQDVQLMNMFIFLFLLAYLLYLREKYLLSVFVFVLSGLVRFPYMGLVSVSSFAMLIPVLRKILHNRTLDLAPREMVVLALFAVSTFILTFQYVWLEHTAPSLILTHASPIMNPLLGLRSKLYTVILLMGPLLFLPLLSKKWILSTLVFFAVAFFFNNPIYVYPEVFLNWYTVAVIPFLFLGTIDAIAMLKRKHLKQRSDSKATETRFRFLRKLTSVRNIASIILLILLVMAIWTEPYGPLNQTSFNNFEMYQDFKTNTSLFASAQEVISLIPESNGNILVQNDIAQLFPRPAVHEILVAPYGIGPDVTPLDIAQNQFPFYGGNSAFVKIDYVITDFNDIHSLMEPPVTAGYPTMLELVEMLYNSSYYGVVAEVNGIILLERGYHGPLKLFQPYSNSVDLETVTGAPYETINHSITINGEFNNVTLRSPFKCMFPGHFSVVASLNVEDYNNSTIWFEAGYYNSNHQFIFGNKTIFPIYESTTGKDYDLNITFDFERFASNAQFFWVLYNFSGSITINSVKILQLA